VSSIALTSARDGGGCQHSTVLSDEDFGVMVVFIFELAEFTFLSNWVDV
jgi:hypothetical protein